MALNSSGPISLGGTTTGQSAGVELGGTGTSEISIDNDNLRTIVRILGSGTLISFLDLYGKYRLTQKGIVGYGSLASSNYNVFNLISNTGVVASDSAGVGVTRSFLAACGYGGDKGIFGYGANGSQNIASSFQNSFNRISNTGVVASDSAGIGTPCAGPGACTYGFDKGIFGLGASNTAFGGYWKTTFTIISNTGAVASDSQSIAEARYTVCATTYGGDKGIFAHGANSTDRLFWYNFISNTGVVASSVSVASQATRRFGTSCTFGWDQGMFISGYNNSAQYSNLKNTVSNTGVISSDITGVGTARYGAIGSSYGQDKGIAVYGITSVAYNLANYISNTGVVAADTAVVGTGRGNGAGCGFSLN